MASKLFIAAAIGSVLMTSQALAADPVRISGLKGDVVLARGGKMALAAPGGLKAGDRVVARGGQAVLTYADGCVVTLKSQAMATIASASPCTGAKGLVSAGAVTAQTTQGMTMLQWTGVGLTVVVLLVGLVSAADDLALSN